MPVMGASMKYLHLLMTHHEVQSAKNEILVGNEHFPAPVYGIRFACGRVICFDEPRQLAKEIRLKQVLG